MKALVFKKSMIVACLCLAAVTITGCKSKVAGKYKDANGLMTIDFEGGTATFSSMIGGSNSVPYTQDGNTITMTKEGMTVTLTISDDGSTITSSSAAMPTLKKVQ